MTELRIIAHYYLNDYGIMSEARMMKGEADPIPASDLLAQIEDAFARMFATTEWGIAYPQLWKDEGFDYPTAADEIPEDARIVFVRIVRNQTIGRREGTVRFEAYCDGTVRKSLLPYGGERMCIYEICPLMVGDEWPDCKTCPYADGTEGDERMTTLVRISRNAASWGVTILIDGVQTIAMDAKTLAISNANGRFRLKARGTDGSHLAAMVDIVVGLEDPKDYEARGVPA